MAEVNCENKEDNRSSKNGEQSVQNNWWVYMILASDNSFYTGVTTDVERRFLQHKNKTGAKYFYGREPLSVVFREDGHSRSSACQREAQIKSFTRKQKERLVMTFKVSDSAL